MHLTAKLWNVYQKAVNYWQSYWQEEKYPFTNSSVEVTVDKMVKEGVAVSFRLFRAKESVFGEGTAKADPTRGRRVYS